jgi:hypothetical protein
MSSKRRSYDTDEITLRKVFAKSFVNNSAIPAQRVLTADGAGGTYWAIPSTLGLNPSFNQINTTAGNFTADLSYNIFTLTAQSGIGFSQGAGSNELNIYGKAFNQIDVSGNNSLYGFTNNVVTPTVKFAGTGGITVLSDPDTNTVVFSAQGTQISTSQFSFARAQVFSNVSTVNDNLNLANSVTLNAASPSSSLRYVGLSDILLSTNTTTNTVFFSLRSNTGAISTLNGNLSNVSTNYVKKTDFSTATNALASTSLGYFNALSTITINGLSTLSTAIGNATVNLSTINLSTTNVFTSTINFNDITNGSLNTLAVSSGTLTLNGQGIVGTVEVNKADLVSTVAGLGTAGYISTLSTNQLSTGWLKAGNAEISTITFKDTGNTNVYGLFSSNASLYFNNAPVGGGTVINNSNFSTSIYQVSSVSTLFAYADFINISSVTNAFLSPDFFSSIFFSTGNLRVSSIEFRDTATATSQFLTVTSGIPKLNSSNIPFTTDLASTVIGLGTAGYISSATLISSVQRGLVSTVVGLGTAGYISSGQLGSTVAGLGAAGFVSTGQLVSSLVGLGTLGYLSSSQLLSTVEGLGSAGYISSQTLISSIDTGIASTVIGLGTAGYISTQSLISSLDSGFASTVIGLGTAGYISSQTLVSSIDTGLASTVIGLGTAGYISTANLVSTITGLGTAGYISSSVLREALVSTTAGIGQGGVTKITAGSNVTISPTSGLGDVTINATGGGGGGTSFTAFSTFLISSLSTFVNPTSVTMEYIGFSSFVLELSPPGGIFTGLSTGNRYSQMSTVQFKIDTFSSYIRSSANLYVGIQYSYLFSYWKAPDFINTNGAAGFDTTQYIKPFVGFSTTLMLGNTPGSYTHDEYTPTLNSNQSLTFACYVHPAGTSNTLVSPNTCNSYTKNDLFALPTTSFENLYRSTFSLYHVLAFGRQSPGQFNQNIAGIPTVGPSNTIISGTSGFSSPNVSVDIGSNNPITLYITN